MEKISIIIPTFNRLQYLKKAIDSVLKQTYQNFELIIIDDGSTDCTLDFLIKFKDKRLSFYPKTNSGVSASRNLGIKKSKYNIIAFLDSDDIWLPKKLAKQIHFFEKNPNYKIAQTEEIWIRNGKRVNAMNKHKKLEGFFYEESLKLCLISPSSVIIKREILNDIGFFDETLPACEDYDSWLRITSKYKVGLIKENLIEKHGGHPDQLSRKFTGMDKFRIIAMLKSLTNNSLNQEQRLATIQEIKKKSKIYANGCIKHGKNQEGAKFLGIYQKIDSFSNCDLRNFQSGITSVKKL